MAGLLKAFETEATVDGTVIGWNKGGFHVSLSGAPAFCPRSQMELGHPKKPATYIDKTFSFRIIGIKDSGKRIVVSRSEVLKRDAERRLAEAMESLAPGTEVLGRVTSLTDFGAFVDLGGVEGLVHRSELSRRRVNHPKEILKTGQEVRVRVTKLEEGGKRISLSMKDLEPDPWQLLEERFPRGSRFTGKILRHADFGLFVGLEPGIEGLVHTSQLPAGKDMSDGSLAVGETVSGWVREFDARRRRISLALREVSPGNPWADAAQRYPAGSIVEGEVEQVTSFGVFVRLEPGLTGLLPSSQISSRGQPGRVYSPGRKVTLRIMSIDSRKQRISLAPQGAPLEGNRADYREYVRKQRQADRGLKAIAAAFAKLDKES